MMRRWLGGSGISVVLHAVLAAILIWAAARPSAIDTNSIPSPRTKMIFTVLGNGVGQGGGDGPMAAAPRPRRPPSTRPPDSIEPRTITDVESPRADVPAIATDTLDELPGARTDVDGPAAGKGGGPGGGGGEGPGSGPGKGPGAGEGDVY